jgi:hydrogenase-1 operon protein HyaF
MSTLDRIGMGVPAGRGDTGRAGTALPIVHQIRHALAQLARTGESSLIDLLAMPFGPGDEALLFRTLGRGEVEARIQALGPTKVWETQYPGVWVVDHYNADAQRVALHVEITKIPQILLSQQHDIDDAIARLDAQLAVVRSDMADSPEHIRRDNA